MFNPAQQIDKPTLVDGSPSLLGVVNLLAPSLLGPTDLYDAQNRLSQNDGISRPRPGKDLVQALPTTINRANGFRHFHDQEFILALTNSSNANKWYKFTGVSSGPPFAGTFTDITTGAPAFNINQNLYSAVGVNNYYACCSGLLEWYNDATWTQVTIGAVTQNFNYPLWYANRLFVVSQNSGAKNTIYGSLTLPNFSLAASQWDTTKLAIQVDENTNDQIVGLAPYFNYQFIAFKSSSIWMVGVYPPSMIDATGAPSFAACPLTRLTGSIGLAEQNTVASVGNDILFLSESGRGVYAVNQLQQIAAYLTSGLISASEAQIFLEAAISRPVQKYIDRINWNAINRAHAAAWDDLYVLSVPIDGSTVCNAILVYCVGTKKWQGIWTGYPDDAFAVQRAGSNTTDLYFIGLDGNFYRNWHAADKLWFDTLSGVTTSPVLFFSSITSKAYRFKQETNLIQPLSATFDFIDTPVAQGITSPLLSLINGVQLTAGMIKDNTVAFPYLESLSVGSGTNVLPLTQLPFNLDDERLYKSMSLRKAGSCEEVQVTLSGFGPWSLYRISTKAFQGRSITII